MSEHTFDAIVDALAARRQRATYSAVAAVVGSAPRALMVGRPRDARHSWIVNKTTGQPTGYGPDQVDPELNLRPEVLKSPEALRTWLGSAT